MLMMPMKVEVMFHFFHLYHLFFEYTSSSIVYVKYIICSLSLARDDRVRSYQKLRRYLLLALKGISQK